MCLRPVGSGTVSRSGAEAGGNTPLVVAAATAAEAGTSAKERAKGLPAACSGWLLCDGVGWLLWPYLVAACRFRWTQKCLPFAVPVHVH